MRSIFFIIGFALIAANIVCACGTADGNGNVVTFEKPVSSFDGITQDSNAHVRFHTGNEYRVVVTADSNLEQYIGIGVKDNALYIGTRMLNQPKFTQFIVDVYAPYINAVSISGSGTFEIADTLAVSSFQAVISGEGTVSGKLECETFEAIISGSGNVKLEGSAETSKIVITGTGAIDCFAFQTNETTVIPTGKGGEIQIWALETLTAEISGDARIVYRGNPAVNFVRHYGKGTVEKKV
jgi:hypothetical protein